MNTVWFAILALVAMPGDRPSARERAETRPVAPIARTSTATVPMPSKAIARRPCHRREGGPSPCATAEDCDTQEGVDETWLVHLDALGSDPISRVCWGPVRSSRVIGRPGRPEPPEPAAFPLRC